MPRGIRFDRYEVPRGGLGGAPGWKIPAETDILPEALGTVSKLAHGVQDTLQKAADLKEKVKVGEAYLSAIEEMDKQFLAIENSPDRERASEVWGKYLEQSLSKWGKGLTSAGSAALQERLLPKRAEFGHRARVLEITDLEQRSNATIMGYAKRFVDSYARSGPDGPEETPEFKELKEAYGHAVAANAKHKDAAAKELLSHRQEASAARAHAMIESGDPNALIRLKDLLNQEDAKPGSTFLGFMEAGRRVAIRKAANDQSLQLRRLRLEESDRARQENERELKRQQEEWERRSDTMVEDGMITNVWIEDGKSLGLASDEKAKFYRQAMHDRKTGVTVPNDEPTFRRLSPEVWSETSNPTSVLAAVKEAYTATPQRINYPTMKEWASHLEARIERAKTTTSKEEQQLDKERTEVQGWIDILTTTRSPFEKFDPAANRLKLSLRTELGKLPRETSAKEWYFKNEARFYGQMRGLAQGYIRTERSSMNVPEANIPPAGTNPADLIAPKKAEYQRKYGAEWKSKMIEDVERLQKIQDLQVEIDAKKPQGDGTPGPKPAAAAPQPAKPAEKKSGPLKPGSRSY